MRAHVVCWRSPSPRELACAFYRPDLLSVFVELRGPFPSNYVVGWARQFKGQPLYRYHCYIEGTMYEGDAMTLKEAKAAVFDVIPKHYFVL